MNTWPVNEAKARFSELLETTLTEGPQIITKRGIETAVIVPIEEWRRLQERARPTLKELLLAPEPRSCERSIDQILAFLILIFGKLDNQYRVLSGQTDEHHQTDLRVHVAFDLYLISGQKRSQYRAPQP